VSRDPDPAHSPSAAEDEIRAVLERARSGDATALPALRRVLDDHPEIWQQYGALATHARQTWIELIGDKDLSLKESLVRQIEAMRATLAGPNPSPLETLLVERIVACWLQTSYADAAAAQTEGLSRKQAEFAVKRQDSAHRRYLMAIATLAMTRRLLVSTVNESARGRRAIPSEPRLEDVILAGPTDPEPIERGNGVEGESVGDDLVIEFVASGRESTGQEPGRSRHR
jgi:hypothetical protein